MFKFPASKLNTSMASFLRNIVLSVLHFLQHLLVVRQYVVSIHLHLLVSHRPSPLCNPSRKNPKKLGRPQNGTKTAESIYVNKLGPNNFALLVRNELNIILKPHCPGCDQRQIFQKNWQYIL